MYVIAVGAVGVGEFLQEVCLLDQLLADELCLGREMSVLVAEEVEVVFIEIRRAPDVETVRALEQLPFQGGRHGNMAPSGVRRIDFDAQDGVGDLLLVLFAGSLCPVAFANGRVGLLAAQLFPAVGA